MPMGDELMALPWSRARAADPDELVPLAQVMELVAGGSGGVLDEILRLLRSVLYVGKMEWSGYRPEELPFGWHAMNGQGFLDTSPQGKALLGTTETFRSDWGIVLRADGMVNVPNFFRDGKGYFVRSADGAARRVGSVQEDAGREVIAGGGKGKIRGAFAQDTYPAAEGVFATGATFQRQGVPVSGSRWLGGAEITMNLREGISTANIDEEYRPRNIGMTPCVYLGA